MQDISTILANLKINLLSINANTDRDEQIVHTRMTIEIHGVDELVAIIDKLSQLPNVQEVRRIA
jgi:GTP pyrophosphokinase